MRWTRDLKTRREILFMFGKDDEVIWTKTGAWIREKKSSTVWRFWEDD